MTSFTLLLYTVKPKIYNVLIIEKNYKKKQNRKTLKNDKKNT